MVLRRSIRQPRPIARSNEAVIAVPFGLIWFGVICLLMLVHIKDEGREAVLFRRELRRLLRG